MTRRGEGKGVGRRGDGLLTQACLEILHQVLYSLAHGAGRRQRDQGDSGGNSGTDSNRHGRCHTPRTRLRHDRSTHLPGGFIGVRGGDRRVTGQSAVGTEAEGAVQRADARLSTGRQGTGGGRQVVVVVVVVMVDGGGGGGAF